MGRSGRSCASWGILGCFRVPGASLGCSRHGPCGRPGSDGFCVFERTLVVCSASRAFRIRSFRLQEDCKEDCSRKFLQKHVCYQYFANLACPRYVPKASALRPKSVRATSHSALFCPRYVPTCPRYVPKASALRPKPVRATSQTFVQVVRATSQTFVQVGCACGPQKAPPLVSFTCTADPLGAFTAVPAGRGVFSLQGRAQNPPGWCFSRTPGPVRNLHPHRAAVPAGGASKTRKRPWCLWRAGVVLFADTGAGSQLTSASCCGPGHRPWCNQRLGLGLPAGVCPIATDSAATRFERRR